MVNSIRFRLTAAYTGMLALTFTLIGVGLWIGLEHSIRRTADRELRVRLEEVRHYIDQFSPNDLLHLEEEFREESLLSQSVAYIRVYDRSGKSLFRTPSTEQWPPIVRDAALLPERGLINPIRVRHDVLRVLTAPVKVGILQVGMSVDELEEVKSGFLWMLGLSSPLFLALAWLGGYWMSGRALKPVDAISSAAARINPRDLSARLPCGVAGDELDRLSGVLNAMLSRLESAFKRINEFTADASHELRTPVAVIQTTAELMQARGRTVEEHLKAWGTITEQTERTSSLISDLLTLARSDAGKNDLEFSPIDLADLVQTAAQDMRVMAEAKGVLVVVNALGPCPVSGDAEALRRAVCILLDNAIKYSSGPSEIRVEVNSHPSASVTVLDAGIGISSEDLPMIFERFYRASKDRSRGTGGAGLGLSIARWIVETHGGEIGVASELGKGSTFTLSLGHSTGNIKPNAAGKNLQLI